MAEENKVEENKVEEKVFGLTVTCPNGRKIEIPKGMFTSRDTVMFLRDLLAEYQDVCHHTNYKLEAVDAKKKHITPLNDYVTFGEYPEVVSGESHLRMKLAPYTLATCHNHVRVIRNIVVDPPVYVPTVVPKEASSDSAAAEKKVAQQQQQQPKKDNAKQQQQQQPKKDNTKQQEQQQPKKDNAKQQEQEQKKEEKQEEAAVVSKNPKTQTNKLLQKLVDDSLAKMEKLTDSNIREAKTKFPDLQVPIDSNVENIRVSPRIVHRQKVQNNKSRFKNKIPGIRFSGWNPPPAPRRLAGDLCYLEVHTPEGSVVNLTATSEGFFVNASRDGHFNPVRATHDSHFNHSLLKVLQKISPVFAKYYSRQLQTGIEKEGDVENEDLSYLSVPWQTSRVPKEPELDLAKSWLEANKQDDHHTYVVFSFSFFSSSSFYS
jgi:flagellar motor protein MotB